MKKEFENILKKNMKIKILHHRKGTGKILNNESIALNILFSSQDGEEITIVYKSEHSLERENKVLLLMINDDDDDDNDEKYHYFAVKSKLELNLSEWLRSKKE